MEKRMHYNDEEVAGFYSKDKARVFCTDCMEPEELKKVEADEIVTDTDIEEGWWFCDRCKKRLN
jgi:hypothetical protein